MSDTPLTDSVRQVHLDVGHYLRVMERLEVENADLRRQLAEAQKDAKRYRWLRGAGWFDDAIIAEHGFNEFEPESVNKAIDAAIAAAPSQENSDAD